MFLVPSFLELDTDPSCTSSVAFSYVVPRTIQYVAAGQLVRCRPTADLEQVSLPSSIQIFFQATVFVLSIRDRSRGA